MTVSKPYEGCAGASDEELGPVIHDLKNAAAALRLRVVLLVRDEPPQRMQNLQQAVERVCACVEKLSRLSR